MTQDRMRIDGKCHCGKISYEADIKLEHVTICHCTDCQTISGGAFRTNVYVALEHFRLRGEPKIYVKTGSSGRQAQTVFCPKCGSAIYSKAVLNAYYVNLRVGAIRQRAQLVPKLQGFCGSAMPWVMNISSIPQAGD